MKKKIKKNFFSNDKKFKNLKIGTKFGFQHKISFQDVQKYASLVRDKNPLHFRTRSSKIKKVMSHGMLVGSLTAALLGTYSPIKNNVLVAISLNFRKPVFTDNKIKVFNPSSGKYISSISITSISELDNIS